MYHPIDSIGLSFMVDRKYLPATMKVEVWQKDLKVIGERMLRFIECFARASRNGLPPAVDPATMRRVDAQAFQLGLAVRRMGPEEA